MSRFQRSIQKLDDNLRIIARKDPNNAFPSSHVIGPLADDFVDFNKQIGNPHHPATLQEMPMMHWQINFKVEMDIAHEKRIGKQQPLKVHANKSRQIGFTDEMQRFFAYHGSGEYEQRDRHWYINKKIIQMSGTRFAQAKEVQTRLRALFNNIENTIADNGTDLWFKLKNGTEYESFPATEGATRGQTKVGAIGADEIAHIGRVDDRPVFNGFMPIVDTNLADLFLYSTPNGRRGQFYHIDITENDFIKLKFPIWVGEGHLFTHDQILATLARKDIDVDQEYLNKYTTTRSSYYGDLFTEGSHDEQDLSKFG